MSRRIEARARGEEWFALKMFGKDAPGYQAAAELEL